MDPLHRIAEEKIREALAQGAFDDLPGKGKPLKLDDGLERVHPSLRAAYKILHNAGLVPPELEARKEALEIEDLLRCVEDEAQRAALRRRRDAAWLRFTLWRERHGRGPVPAGYEDRLLERLRPDPPVSGR